MVDCYLQFLTGLTSKYSAGNKIAFAAVYP
jgi:hypothetical protein